MHRGPAGISVEALLQHRGWVRALARGLAADAASADDLEQEVWLTALRSPPAHASGLRAWLARVLRSRASDARRSEAARGERERRSARPEATEPSTERLAQIAELQSRIARAVLALEEPYRSTILLRYFEELSLEEVADRTGAPLETVRTRIRRAHERLREALDRDHDGDRAAWVALLAPLAREAGPTPPPIASVRLRAPIAAVAILLAAVTAWRLAPLRPAQEPPAAPIVVAAAPRPPAPPSPPEPVSAPPAIEAPVAPPAAAAAAPAAPVDPPPPVAEPPAPPVPPAPDGVRAHGRVLDDHRRPVAGATVTFRVPGFVEVSTLSDSHGRFEVRVPPRNRFPCGRSMHFANGAFRAVAPDGKVGFLPAGWRSEDCSFPHEIVVSEPLGLAIRVVDARGPVPGADVALWTSNCCADRATTGRDGQALLGPLPSRLTSVSTFGRPLIVVARAEGRGAAEASADWPPRDDGPLTLRLSSRDYSVQVVDGGTGAGIEGAELRISQRFETEGFEDTVPDFLRGIPLRTGPGGLATIRGLSAEGKYSFTARAEGYGDPDRQAWMTLYLQPDRPTRIALARARTIRWPVTEEEGPVPPHGTPVRLQWYSTTRSAQSAWLGAALPEPPAREGRVEVSRSDGARVVVDGLGGGPQDLTGTVPFSWAMVAVIPDGRQARLVAPKGTDLGPPVSFRSPRTLTVQVRDEDGKPRSGVEAMVAGTGKGRRLGAEYAVTGSDGTAVLPGLYGGEVLLFLREPRTWEFEKSPAGSADLEKGDARIEAVLAAWKPVECLARFRVDGESRLPPDMRLLVSAERRGTVVEDAVEDPAEATARFTVWLLRPEDRFLVSAVCYGLASKPADVPAGPRVGPVEMLLDFATVPAPRPQSEPAAPFRPNAPLEGESRDQRLVRVLDTVRTSVTLERTSLADALRYLGASQGINIVMDGDAETRCGDVEVTVQVKDYTLRDAILEVLKVREELGIVLRDGCVVVVRR